MPSMAPATDPTMAADGVGVAAGRRGQAHAGPGRGGDREDAEGGHDRLLGGHAGAHDGVELVGPGLGGHRRQVRGDPGDPGADLPAGHPVAAPGREVGRGDGDLDAVPRGPPAMPALTAAPTAAAAARPIDVLWVTMDAATTASTRAASGSGGVATPTGAMRMAAPLVAPLRPASAGGVPAASRRVRPWWRGRAGPGSPSRPWPVPSDQGLGEGERVDAAVARDEQPGQQQRLLGVVGDRAGGHPGRDDLARPAARQPGDRAVVGEDVGAPHRLGRHAQGIADGQAGQGAQRAVGQCPFVRLPAVRLPARSGSRSAAVTAASRPAAATAARRPGTAAR